MHGLIPACAGKTLPRGHPASVRQAHPRVCGENAADRHTGTTAWGSSPRVRGKLRIDARPRPCTRLIPACAGKTKSKPTESSPKWAHPRVCGENVLLRVRTQPVGGSSPRVRGKPQIASYPPSTPRLIPACAGKTAGAGVGRLPRPAHPRVCGENFQLRCSTLFDPGSSPRVRGKLNHYSLRRNPRRLIPACAGKTRLILQPRVERGGSSPRVRGKPVAR